MNPILDLSKDILPFTFAFTYNDNVQKHELLEDIRNFVETKNDILIQRQFTGSFGCKPTDITTTMASVDEAIKSTLSANRV
jgi:hypothetical protein